ncbi:hypothetical protein PCE1_001859 [Barthelona sp. PCE]
MLLLFNTSGGYFLYKVKDTNALKQPNKFHKHLGEILEVQAFEKFNSLEDSTEACRVVSDNDVPESLKNFLKKNIEDLSSETLIVDDPKLGNQLKGDLGLNFMFDNVMMDLFRSIRTQIDTFLEEYSSSSLKNTSVGVAHNLSRYRIQFSANKLDTSLIQAVSILEDLDKQINMISMRIKEWYGQHFPNLEKVVSDMLNYCHVVDIIGFSVNAPDKYDELVDVIGEELADEVIAASKLSSGVDITDTDLDVIQSFAKTLIRCIERRNRISTFLHNRVEIIAPNVVHLLGHTLAAKMISHAGSLMQMAKWPASTIQIIGAEKSFFQAVKENHKTPKYGFIFQSSIVSGTNPDYKGKIARQLGCELAKSSRVDGFSEMEEKEVTIGYDGKERLVKSISECNSQKKKKTERGSRYQSGAGRSRSTGYNNRHDVQMGRNRGPPRKKQRY